VPSICCHLPCFSSAHFGPSSRLVHEFNSDLQENKTCYLFAEINIPLWDFMFSMQWLWSFLWHCAEKCLYCSAQYHTPNNNSLKYTTTLTALKNKSGFMRK
jgi:hypothetical protein